jgi:hypothetical protein
MEQYSIRHWKIWDAMMMDAVMTGVMTAAVRTRDADAAAMKAAR